jgi:hypothetical protein
MSNTNEIRCRTRPYYYIMRVVQSVYVQAALTALVAAIMVLHPVCSPLGWFTLGVGVTLVAWSLVNPTEVKLKQGDRA